MDNYLVGEEPGGVAGGAVPGGNGGQGDGLDAHISCPAAKAARGKGLDFGYCQAGRVIRME